MFVKNADAQGFSVKAWQGDAKTLLAFNFAKENTVTDLAGFSIQVQPHGQQAYYLLNMLVLPGTNHAKLPGEPDNSSANQPIQKFRWLHVPGLFHQGDNVFYGVYTYTITPRYFKKSSLLPLDATLSVSVEIAVQPFASGQVALGFTRGFTQSQAFVHHFGSKAIFRPGGKDLVFDTSGNAGKNDAGQSYTFAQEYEWSGFTARKRIFEILDEVENDPTASMDVFAYDLNEPDILQVFLKLAGEGRIRIILDNATLHHSATAAEDQFEKQFRKAMTGNADMLRGKYGRFAHDKVFIVYKAEKAVKVLTGSTNFSVTGMYVNSNHVLVFDSTDVAQLYAQVFDESWNDQVSMKFNQSSLSEQPFVFNQRGLPNMSITFSPHSAEAATGILNKMADKIKQATNNVLFAVMDISSGGGPIFPALNALHSEQTIFSYGISDASQGIFLYKPGSKEGVLVGGKPGQTMLPPPFDKEHSIALGHQIHHKFIVCDFGTDHAVVWCGSSNLALGGEQQNGDNLLQIQDQDITTVFAIEAIGLVDHFDFRDSHMSNKPNPATATKAPKGASAKTRTKTSGTGTTKLTGALNLLDNDSWAKRYFDQNDLHCSDRLIFG